MIKMINQKGLVADVHPDEVSNFAKGGYVAVDGVVAAPKPAAIVAPPAPVALAEEPRITSKAADLAAEAGLDLSAIVGTGKDGKITVEDVEAAIEKLTAPESDDK